MAEEKESAALLLAQWKEAMMTAIDCIATEPDEHISAELIEESTRQWMEKVGGLSRRLDDLAQKAGIYLHNEHFHYSVIQANHDKGNSQTCFRISNGGLPAVEQQALQEWLLIKEKQK